MKEKDTLLTVLHGVQDRSFQSYISGEELEKVRLDFNVTKARIRGVASYYSMFSLKPRGRYVLRICVSPVCRMMGGVDIAEYLEKKLGISMGETTKDGVFTLEETQCLGRCAGAPAMMAGRGIHEGLTADKIDLILENLRGSKDEK